MKSRLTRNLLKDAVLLIFFIFIFIQACGPTPATALTDTTRTPIRNNISGLKSDIIMGTGLTLSINNLSANSVQIGFEGGGTAKATLTNISGDSGNYTYGNNEMTLSVKVADDTSVTVTLTRLKEPYLLLENITCYK